MVRKSQRQRRKEKKKKEKKRKERNKKKNHHRSRGRHANRRARPNPIPRQIQNVLNSFHWNPDLNKYRTEHFDPSKYNNLFTVAQIEQIGRDIAPFRNSVNDHPPLILLSGVSGAISTILGLVFFFLYFSKDSSSLNLIGFIIGFIIAIISIWYFCVTLNRIQREREEKRSKLRDYITKLNNTYSVRGVCFEFHYTGSYFTIRIKDRVKLGFPPEEEKKPEEEFQFFDINIRNNSNSPNPKPNDVNIAKKNMNSRGSIEDLEIGEIAPPIIGIDGSSSDYSDSESDNGLDIIGIDVPRDEEMGV